LLNPIYQADGSGTSWGEDAPALIYPDTDGLYIHEDDYPEKDQMLTYFEDSIVIEIAAEVQKAIELLEKEGLLVDGKILKA